MSGRSFSDRLVGDWYRPRRTALTLALTPFGWLFGAIAALRRAAYRSGILQSTALAVPVIVIGNITAGGTGKTPLAIALVNGLRMRGSRPGIVSRGYGAAGSMPRAVLPDSDPDDAGDEPPLLARTGVPVWIGADRVATASALLATHPEVDVIVSDDGLQHYALHRDCEIVVVDGGRGFGNGRLLPAGPLRERVARLRDVDAIVVNGGNDGPVADARASIPADAAPVFPMTLDGDRFVNLADGRIAFARDFEGRRVHAVAGIGHPGRFFATLRTLGLDPACHPFPDHHRFTREDFSYPDADAVVMTEKDAIKCGQFADARMWSLPVTARIDPALIDRVLQRALEK